MWFEIKIVVLCQIVKLNRSVYMCQIMKDSSKHRFKRSKKCQLSILKVSIQKLFCCLKKICYKYVLQMEKIHQTLNFKTKLKQIIQFQIKSHPFFKEKKSFKIKLTIFTNDSFEFKENAGFTLVYSHFSIHIFFLKNDVM